jgi:hypothetical protein
MRSQRSAAIRPFFVEPVDFQKARGKPILRPPKQWLCRVRFNNVGCNTEIARYDGDTGQNKYAMPTIKMLDATRNRI